MDSLSIAVSGVLKIGPVLPLTTTPCHILQGVNKRQITPDNSFNKRLAGTNAPFTQTSFSPAQRYVCGRCAVIMLLSLCVGLYAKPRLQTFEIATLLRNFPVCSSTPSSSHSYANRSGKGSVVSSWGATENLRWKSTRNEPLIVQVYDDFAALKKKFKHMFQKLSDKALGTCDSILLFSNCSFITLLFV